MLGYPNVISEEALHGLKKYKYSAIDMSPISNYILQPYWTWAATLFPIWMAPNLITLLGFIMVLINFLILMYYAPELDTPGPSWMYFSCALGMWLYSTFDNVDGKQARRTKSSSPLGELFDHGIDALNCTTGALIQAGAMLSGTGASGFFVVAMANIVFFFSTWETYYTGTLYLGYINGPTEGLLAAIAAILASGFYGPMFWKTPLGQIYNTPFEWVNQMELQFGLLVGFGLLSLFTQIPVSVYRALDACKQKGISRISAILNLGSFLSFCISVGIWAYAPNSTIIPHNTVLLLLAAGFACGRINAMIVLQHVTHMEYPRYAFLVLPFMIGAVITTLPQTLGISVFTPQSERLYVIAVLCYVILDYVFWAQKVVEQFCKHLNIKCFSIPIITESEPVKLDARPPSPKKNRRRKSRSPSSLKKRNGRK